MSIDRALRGEAVHQFGGRAHPANPQPAPDRLGQRTDRDHGGVERGGRRPRAGEAQLDERLVDDDGRAGMPGAGGARRVAALADKRAGRIVEVGDQERQSGQGLAQRRLQFTHLPAVPAEIGTGTTRLPLARIASSAPG